MILCIADVLDRPGLDALRESLAGGVYVDGELSSGWASRLVKKNEQLGAGPAARKAQEQVVAALSSNPVFAAAVLPRRFAPPLFARYTPGMEFGTHMDNAVMGAERMRSDVSVTLFLTEPEEYDGGELVMESAAGEAAYKLPAGSAVAYPSTMLHRVAPVTRGTREVAVTWAQSLVRGAEQREILFDLERVGRALFERDGKSPEFDLLNKSAANLRRMWVES
ncbi:MAG TPA: Fe2+-dependent dioxygenase [Amaricoccus sp.]|mgnify:CR=1 FL=1|uniref:Fe2+-dependent dioxygenase n=1 Tax=Amaricoccus sp. TaxID=1872485 RepID=UPI002D14F902|nr:Fe2+-dependent dioxygenase [Amaricoccus sp.]HMQ93708.1 Fe2+-dependent dioxygenase [Amaricoccus sp.]HMR52825.1 Fe2+-dependent dioxygenase [Amaricoccus sp.]HMR60237.1 Fe2+-dependent dioxygenase [Amaricoccus sp.]HMT99760.1 Fe2+-dependent dioxygenase [Amaricoccus sp.]